MFDKYFNSIVTSMINRLNSFFPKLDTKPGSIARHLAIETPAEQLALLKEDQDKISSAQSISTAVGSDLDDRVADFGIKRGAAQKSTVYITLIFAKPVAPSIISAGQIVSTAGADSLSFQITETYEIDPAKASLYQANAALIRDKLDLVGISGTYASSAIQAVALAAGSEYNVGAYSIVNHNIAGISDVINIDPAYGGSDEESDEDLRARGLLALAGSNTGTPDNYLTIVKNTVASDGLIVGAGHPLMLRDGTVYDDSGNLVQRGDGGSIDVYVLGATPVLKEETYIYRDLSLGNGATDPLNDKILGRLDIENPALELTQYFLPIRDLFEVVGSQSGVFIKDVHYKLIKDEGVYANSGKAIDKLAWLTTSKQELLNIKHKSSTSDSLIYSDILKIINAYYSIEIQEIITGPDRINQWELTMPHSPITNVLGVFNLTVNEQYGISYFEDNIISLYGNIKPKPGDLISVKYIFEYYYDENYDYKLFENKINWGFLPSPEILLNRLQLTKYLETNRVEDVPGTNSWTITVSQSPVLSVKSITNLTTGVTYRLEDIHTYNNDDTLSPNQIKISSNQPSYYNSVTDGLAHSTFGWFISVDNPYLNSLNSVVNVIKVYNKTKNLHYNVNGAIIHFGHTIELIDSLQDPDIHRNISNEELIILAPTSTQWVFQITNSTIPNGVVVSNVVKIYNSTIQRSYNINNVQISDSGSDTKFSINIADQPAIGYRTIKNETANVISTWVAESTNLIVDANHPINLVNRVYNNTKNENYDLHNYSIINDNQIQIDPNSQPSGYFGMSAGDEIIIDYVYTDPEPRAGDIIWASYEYTEPITPPDAADEITVDYTYELTPLPPKTNETVHVDYSWKAPVLSSLNFQPTKPTHLLLNIENGTFNNNIGVFNIDGVMSTVIKEEIVQTSPGWVIQCSNGPIGQVYLIYNKTTDVTYNISSYYLKNTLYAPSASVDNNLTDAEIKIDSSVNPSVFYPRAGDILIIKYMYYENKSETHYISSNGLYYSHNKFIHVNNLTSSGFEDIKPFLEIRSNNKPKEDLYFNTLVEFVAPKEGENISIQYYYNKLINDISTIIDEKKPVNTDVLVKEAQPYFIDVKVKIELINDKTINPTDIKNEIESLLITYFNKDRLGGRIDNSDVISLIDSEINFIEQIKQLSMFEPNSNFAKQTVIIPENQYARAGEIQISIISPKAS